MSEHKLTGTKRSNVEIGDLVEVVKKQHQRSGELTEGLVTRLLTSSSSHPHGIKVMLDSGEVGRVQWVLKEDVD
ncbi:MAG: putative repeat protein (TIGR03833 family) [Bacteroidia bacterium]|jgi:uncharacterized repeat protein (TIGR03833 family)